MSENPPTEAAAELDVTCTQMLGRRAEITVWRATRADGSPVALTALDIGTTAEEHERFGVAAENCMGLQVPGLLCVHTMTAARDAFISDLWTTGTVTDLPALRWSLAQKLGFVRRVCETLGGLHAQGRVHGCLCPGNIALDDNLAPVLTEVSMVCVATSLNGDRDNAFGFGAYAAPEAMDGEVTDPRADVFSVGRLLLFLLTNADPGQDVDAALKSAPPRLAEVVRRCLAAAFARYPTMEELATALVRCVEEAAAHEARKDVRPSVAAPPRKTVPPAQTQAMWEKPGLSRPSRWRRPVLLGLSLAALAGVVVLVGDPGGSLARGSNERRLRSESAAERAKAAYALIVEGDRKFASARLPGIDLSGMDLSGADFSGADLTGAMLRRSNLTGATLDRVKLAGAYLQGANLTGVALDSVVEIRTAFCDETTVPPASWSCDHRHFRRTAEMGTP